VREEMEDGVVYIRLKNLRVREIERGNTVVRGRWKHRKSKFSKVKVKPKSRSKANAYT